ncbi:MAG: GHMP kinase [Nitrospinaceae bacterium]
MIRSSAPTRIDLAGGTLDIWPLYLHFDNPPTLNAAIDLYATVDLYPRKDKSIIVESRDLGLRSRFRSIDALPGRHPLELILRTLKFYRPETGLEIVTDCEAPAGSGIGGSSALNIALHGALNALTRKGYKKVQMLEVARNIETQVITVPAGWQDYFPALYGGALAVRPGLTGVDFERLPIDPKELTRRFVLCYTGKPRHSGINNWKVMKMALDGDRRTLARLAGIKKAAEKMKRVLSGGRIDGIGPLFAEEWRARKALAPGISTPVMDRMIATAMKSGALAAKVCGAGGGGCVAFFVKKGKKDRVAAALEKRGARVLKFRFVGRGLVVRRT